MKLNSVTAFAPATVANVGLGFDFMGFALDGQGDRVTVSMGDDTGETFISLNGKYGSLVPSDPLKNTAGIAVSSFLKTFGPVNKSIRIHLEKNLPLGSGLGSSASSAVASLVALNRLFGDPFLPQDLLPFAMEGEKAACGTGHVDNAAPSLLGGFVIIRSYSPIDIIQVNCPEDLFCTVIHPHIELKTSDARRILKREIPLADVTKQCANVAGFITGILEKDYELISRSMHDLLAEPKRVQLIPGYDLVRDSALKSGALGCGISGSGPSVFALCRGEVITKTVSEAMQEAMKKSGLDSDTYISTLRARGAYIV